MGKFAKLMLLGVVVGVGWYVISHFSSRNYPEPESVSSEELKEPAEVAVPAISSQLRQPLSSESAPQEIDGQVVDILAVSETKLVTTAVDGTLTPPPYYPVAVDYDQQALWLSEKEYIDGGVYWWSPVTGVLKFYPLEQGPFTFFKTRPSAIATPAGLFLIGGQYIADLKWKYDPTRVALITRDGKLLTARLQVERDRPKLILLRDESLLVVGAYAEQYRKKDGSRARTFTNAVERISYSEGGLLVERLPDLPGEPRRGISLVELSDGRIMALGGSSSPYAASEPISAQTHFLDAAAGTWSDGPRMEQARVDATATLMANGDVLVTGGWTPKFDWQNGPTRSAERWDSTLNQFVPASSLSLRMANHQAVKAPEVLGNQLLLAGGMVGAWNGNGVVLGYDRDREVWRVIGENCVSHNRDGSVFVVSLNQTTQSQIWCFETGVPLESAWSVVTLRSSAKKDKSIARIDLESGIALQRSELAFLPPQGDLPGLVVGGGVNGSATGAVDALWLDGRIKALAPLSHPRAYAQAFRLPDGSLLVAGGIGDGSSARTNPPPPPEILAPAEDIEQAAWQALDMRLPAGSVWGQLRDGSFLVFKSEGSVEHVNISWTADGKPLVQRSDFAPLNRTRHWHQGRGIGMNVVVRELEDKRIIVAGGVTPRHRIALLDNNSLLAGGVDRYVSRGMYRDSMQYEIYDPVKKMWQESVPSRTEGSRAAILADGRVVKWGTIPTHFMPGVGYTVVPEADPAPKVLLEISNAEGTAWQEFESQQPSKVDISNYGFEAKPFVIDGELFLSGSSPEARSGIGLDTVQWFNSASRNWEAVWEMPQGQDWRDNVGRIVIRDLANGKRVMLPVTEK